MNQQVSEPSLDAIPLVLTRAAGCAAGCGHFLPEIRCSAVGLSCRFSGRFSTAVFWARQQCRLRTAQRQRFGSRGLRAQTESIASSEDDHFHRCGVDAMRRSKAVQVMPQPAAPTAVSHVDLPLLQTRGHARTSRYVWTNPLQRSASADGG